MNQYTPVPARGAPSPDVARDDLGCHVNGSKKPIPFVVGDSDK